MHGYVARVSVEALSGSIFGHDFRQGSKVNTGLQKRSAIIRGNYYNHLLLRHELFKLIV